MKRYRRKIDSTAEQAKFLREMVEKLVSTEHEYEEGGAGAGTR